MNQVKFPSRQSEAYRKHVLICRSGLNSILEHINGRIFASPSQLILTNTLPNEAVICADDKSGVLTHKPFHNIKTFRNICYAMYLINILSNIVFAAVQQVVTGKDFFFNFTIITLVCI
jgi:hypothetical protein